MKNLTAASFLSLLFICIGCTNKPTDKDVEESLIQHFNSSVKISGLKCDYEQWPEINGTKMYRVTFYCNVEFTKSYNLNDNVVAAMDSVSLSEDIYEAGETYRIDSGSLIFTDMYDIWTGSPTSMNLQKMK